MNCKKCGQTFSFMYANGKMLRKCQCEIVAVDKATSEKIVKDQPKGKAKKK